MEIKIVSAEELARATGYTGATSSFYDWCAAMRITPLPGRKGVYDLALVRRRLDEAQGLFRPAEGDRAGGLSAVEARRLRRGAA